MWEFQVLGPVRAQAGDRTAPAGSARERFVLAALLLNAGRLTQAARLIDALWADPPASARAQLHNIISKWRRRLGGPLILTRPAGYELHLGEHRLDLHEFRRLAQLGRTAAGRGNHEAAAVELSAALAQWRGPALADVTDALAAGPRQALEQERLAAAETLLQAWLALGRQDEALTGLATLLADHPYRERLSELQMRALSASGRRAEALAVYQRLRGRLVEELGVEPGPALVQLHRRLLDDEEPPQPQAPAAPHQLPPVAGIVTGREKLLAEIRAELLRDHRRQPVVLLVGPGGVGKSTLALCVAHALAGIRTDGELYADLGGSRPVPADPHAVAGRFLRALGVDAAAVPDDQDERIALYRSRLSGRRVLVLLDDAAGDEQVRPLLPGAAGCLALVTSRRTLAAQVGALRWTVPVLTARAAQELLGRLVGIERASAEPGAAAAIAHAAGHLPLAVSIAGARLAARPDWTLGEFAGRMADERGRLDELAIGDLDVRASIALSHRALNRPLRVLFRRLGLIAAPDWPAWVVGPLAGHPQRLLDQLVEAHLVEPRGRDAVGQPRFGLHGLVAEFARERAHAEDDPVDRTQAVHRLLSSWLALATEADSWLQQSPAGSEAGPAPTASVVPVARGPYEVATELARTASSDWFEAERPALVAAVEQACALAATDAAAAAVAGRLALRLTGFLRLRDHRDDWERTLAAAVACARGRVDDQLLGDLLGALFRARAHRARDTGLSALADEQVTVARRLRDRRMEVHALDHAGVAARRAGRLVEAAARFDEAMVACADGITDELYADVLQGRAQVHGLVGEHAAAVTLSGRSVAIGGEHPGRTVRTALRLAIHGDVLLDAGLVDEAEHAYAEAMSITRELSFHAGTAILDGCLGRVDTHLGRWRAADARLTRSLANLEAQGDFDDIAEVLDALGELALARGVAEAATEPLRRSLELWRRVGAPLAQARTHALLAAAHTAGGNDEAAVEQGDAWRAILRDLGLTEASLRLPAFIPPQSDPVGEPDRRRMDRGT